MKTVLVLIALSLSACATAPMTQAEQSVRVLKKSDAPATCKELLKVTAAAFSAWTPDGREENLKRETAKVGGDVVTLDRADENGTLYGTAFNCAGGK